MVLLRTLIIVTAGVTAFLSLGWLVYHYLTVTEQFFRLVMLSL